MENKEQIIKNVASLLQEVPSSMEVVKDDDKKQERFYILAKHMVDKAIRHDALLVTKDLNGIAILFDSNDMKEPFIEELKADLKLAIHVTGITKGLKALKHQAHIKKQRPKDERHLYCWFWGIMPEARGSDNDKTPYVMKDWMFDIAKEKQLPIYAETRLRRVNVAYRRYGFKMLKEWQHPSGDIMYFLRYQPPKN
ncbi:MAG: hypothetical protein RI558_00595 [Psychroflexus sp.]|jgi:hypothetical protein|nr:hypothetical protein [Psychroflexus sp.]MDR9447822.1 hypothetical protein [Psychroflexus sp.]